MKKIAVVLSGCGFKDGSEITESISTLIALSQHRVQYEVFAPNIEFTATDHLTGHSQEPRSTLTESARITRGQIKDLKELNSQNFDAIIFPGGYGAALHLCNWAQKGAQCEVHPLVEKSIVNFFEESKPIGAICIAPALIARVLGSHNPTVTIGNDLETSLEIEKTGAHHENCTVNDYISDRTTKIITTPAYMYEAQPHEVFEGISKLVKEVVEMA